MAKINLCFKRTFVFFNSLFVIFGLVIIAFALYVHTNEYVDKSQLYGIVICYVLGFIMFAISALAAYGAYKESKWALIVFSVLMNLGAIGLLRFAIPIANSQKEIISVAKNEISTMSKETLKSVQENVHCCGRFEGYSDWIYEVPESCNCDEYAQSDSCISIRTYKTYRESTNRRVWSKPCGPILMNYVEKILTITLAVMFTLAALAILGSLMSLMMIVRINTPEHTQPTPSLALSHQPPKYSEVANF